MKKIFIIIILNCFFFLNLYAEIVKKIEIIGNDRITDETIKVYADIIIDKDYDSAGINNITKQLYSTNFFESIEINLRNNLLLIKVKEFPIINKIVLDGEPTEKISKEIKKIISSKERGSFIKNNISQDINLIKTVYKSLGYSFAKIDSKIREHSENRVDVYFLIERGEKIKITKINFIGDKKIRTRRLRDIIVSEEDKFWKVISKNTVLNENNINLDKRLLENYYKSLGYYDVQIISDSAEVESDKNFAVLTYNINAGTRYIVSKVSTNIDSSLNKNAFVDLSKQYKKMIGDYYSPFKIKKTLEFLDNLIIENDLQFIEHSVNELIEENKIELTVNIFESKKIFVERINVIGNSITNEDVIRSEFLIDEGDPFNKLKLEKTKSELKARNIFGEVNYKVKGGSSKDTRVIDFTIEEKPTGEITAGAGVGTDGGSFMFKVAENNFLGRGINLATFAQVNANTLKGAIEVSNPNFDYTGNEVSVNISSITNDVPDSGYENSLISLGAGTRFEQFKDVYLSTGFSASSDKLTVLSNASKQLKKQAGTFGDLSVYYGLALDERDRPYMPSSGHYTSFSQSLPVVSDAGALKNTFATSHYHTFSQDLIGSIKFYASTINGISEDVRISKRIFLPSNKLRGFESGKIGPKDGTDYVGGNYATALNFEARFPNLLPDSSNIDINMFLDMANLWGVDYDTSIEESNILRSSAGLSTNWLSPIGPLSFVFAQDIKKAKTDRTEGFKFQLGTTF